MNKTRLPEHLDESELSMSNFDHSIDAGMEEELRLGKTWGSHFAWEFCGHVWFADGMFHEEVLRHTVYRGTFSAPTLKELMEIVNDEFGSN